MTVKQIFKLIGGGIVALLFAILGIQRKKIVKQKEEIKEAEEDVKVAEAKAEQAAQQTEQVIVAVQQANATEEALDTQQATNEQVIQEAKDDKEVLDFATALIDNFNNKL
jgi:crotonobetainyl-CoA:carnitine CoA-transferase CaiB-like acyl-CoA transferase